MKSLPSFLTTNLFSLISWGVTLFIAAALIGSTLWLTQSRVPSLPDTQSQDTTAVNPSPITPGNPSPAFNMLFKGIGRQLILKTDTAQRQSYTTTEYRVERGDSVFGIAKQFNIKPETVLYSNEASLYDNPSNLAPGMTLQIPPIDGLLYTWGKEDTFESVAKEFKTTPEDILYWPGNNIDLTDPEIKPGSVVMIPGGQRELVSWLEFVNTYNRGSGTATTELGGGACPGLGSGSAPFRWPTNGAHTLSGNDFGPKHLGIDITAYEGTPVLASGGGVVVFAGWSQYGYGNVVQIDHGNGWGTVYAHLNQINVKVCQYVSAGELIGLSGSTGNSTGPHLHFEIRRNGTALNPWELLS